MNKSGINIIEEFREIASVDYNPFLKKSHEEGKKIMGYFCSYIPEEVLHAAGFVPFRMNTRGSQGTTKGDVYFSSLNCTFVRHCFDKALNGDFSFLDGIVFLNGCDHNRRMYDNWRHADLSPEFRFMFAAPHIINRSAERRLAAEIKKLIQHIEEHFALTVSPEALGASIALYNERRRLLQEIDRLRESSPSPLRGSEFLAILQGISVIPVEASIDLLSGALAFFKEREAPTPGKVRVFLAAGCIEEVAHLEMIEEAEGDIIGDTICLGSRYHDLLVSEEGDPVAALAERYLRHVSCPRMMNDFRGRIEYIARTIKERNIEAVIAEKLKFCDLWGGELFIYRNEFKKRSVPLLALERELYSGAEGQARTRLQAFFEQVKNRKDISTDLVRTAGNDYRFKE